MNYEQDKMKHIFASENISFNESTFKPFEKAIFIRKIIFFCLPTENGSVFFKFAFVSMVVFLLRLHHIDLEARLTKFNCVSFAENKRNRKKREQNTTEWKKSQHFRTNVQ